MIPAASLIDFYREENDYSYLHLGVLLLSMGSKSDSFPFQDLLLTTTKTWIQSFNKAMTPVGIHAPVVSNSLKSSSTS